jgi:4-amino-4-deoxy-L-arabinose transferase-like glycosyltransferase
VARASFALTDPGHAGPADPIGEAPSARPPLLAPVALAGLLAFFLWQFLAKSWLLLRSPYSPDYGEGQVLAIIQRMVLDGTFFGDLQRYPMVHSVYAPVYPLLNVPGYLLFGPTLLQPRLVSFVATLVLAAFLFALVRRRTGHAWLASAFGLLLFAPWFVQTWAATARVDMLAQMLSIAGLYSFDRLWPARDLRRYLPFLVFGLAFYTRQTTLVAPAAVLASLLLGRERRRDFPRALAAFAVPVLLALALLAWATRGQAWLHLFPYAATAGYDLGHMARWYGWFLLLVSPLLLVVLTALVRRPRALVRGASLPFALFWVLSMGGLTTIAKEGAAQNYFIEAYVATLLLAGIALGALVRARDVPPRAWPTVPIVALLAIAVLNRGLNWLPQPIRAPQNARAFAALDEAVRATTGPILSENLSVLVVNRKRVWAEPWGLMLLGRKGNWDPSLLAGDCRRQMFDLVIVEWRLLEIAGLPECFEEAYQPWQDLGPYQLLRPKPRAAPREVVPSGPRR